MKKLLKTNYDRSTEYNKIQHSKVRIEQETVSNVRPKKTTSFEQKKDRRWADELGRETSQHLTWCRSAVRQKAVFIRTMVNLWKSSKEGNPKKFRRPFEKKEQIWAANETEVFFKRQLSLEDRDEPVQAHFREEKRQSETDVVTETNGMKRNQINWKRFSTSLQHQKQPWTYKRNNQKTKRGNQLV